MFHTSLRNEIRSENKLLIMLQKPVERKYSQDSNELKKIRI